MSVRLLAHFFKTCFQHTWNSTFTAPAAPNRIHTLFVPTMDAYKRIRPDCYVSPRTIFHASFGCSPAFLDSKSSHMTNWVWKFCFLSWDKYLDLHVASPSHFQMGSSRPPNWQAVVCWPLLVTVDWCRFSFIGWKRLRYTSKGYYGWFTAGSCSPDLL